MQIGRKIYYDLATGNIIQDIGDCSDDVIETTVEQDFAAYASLAERVPETVGCLQLAYREKEQDFEACSGYRVDVSGETPSLLFLYHDPNAPEEPPVYRKPLSEVIAEQDARIADVELALAELFTV
ncbi:hypothetical protein [Cohnella mopanensis]|uniref:hypothetical protein n=1 Tax=Cohnella mopanensis TaxID=2911966 RepID=UPI001EF91F27|nr:hypothetical protein [Cohnella mopanensis]